MSTPDVQWSDADDDLYRRARHLLNEVILAIDARLDAAPPRQEIDRLQQTRHLHVEERRTISVTDRATNQRIVETYPAVIERIDAGGL